MERQLSNIPHHPFWKHGICALGILYFFSCSYVYAINHAGVAPGEVLVSWEGGNITLLDFMKFTKTVKSTEINTIKPSEVKPILSEMALDDYLSKRAAKEKFGLDKVLLAVEESRVRRQLLPPMYVKEEISKKVTVSDKEIGDIVGEYRPVYVVRVFSSRDKSKADMVSTLLLKEGRKFEDVVREFSEGMSRETGGLYGEITEDRQGPFEPDQFKRISALGAGKFTDPMELPTGWTIVYMDRIVTAKEQKEAAIAKMRDVVKLDKERRLYRDKVEMLRKKAAIRWNEKVKKQLVEYAEKGEMGIAQVPRDLARRAVVTVNKTPVYVGEVVQAMSASHGQKELETFFNKRIEDELVIQEATRLKLDRRVAVEMGMARRHWIARSYLDRKTKDAGRTDEKDLREYYEKNSSQFREPEKRALQIIQMRDEKTAEKVHEEVLAGKSFDLLAQEYNDFEEGRKAKGYAGFMSSDQLAPDVRTKIFSMKEGEISETFRVKDPKGVDYFVVVRVISIRPAQAVPFEKVSTELLKDRVVAGRKSAALKSFLEGGPALRWHEDSIRTISTGG